jgi:cobalt-zinc-cadmium efflux system outer membrane protein
VITGLALTGCRTYEAKPIDLASSRATFLERTPDRPEIAEFARRLSQPADQTSFDPADGLSLAEAEAVCLFFNVDLRIARAEAGVAEANAANAGLWPDPVFGLEWTRLLDSSLNPNELFGSIAFTIPISGRLEVEKERLGAAHAQTLAAVAAAEWAARIELRRRWSEWTAEAALLASTAGFVERAEALLSVVDTMQSLGELSRVEARLFRLERVKAAAQLDRFAAIERETRLEILRLLGLPPASDAFLVPAPLGGDEPSRDVEDADAESIRRSPRLAVAVAAYEVAEKTLEEAIRAQIPDVGLTPGYGTQDGIRQFTLGAYLPIPIFSGNRQAIESALAAREVARLVVEREIESIVAEAASARTELESLARQRAIVEDELVPLVELQYAETRELARLGEVDTLILLDGLKQQHEATLRLVEVLRDERLAAIALEAVAGPPIVEPAASPEPIPTTGAES